MLVVISNFGPIVHRFCDTAKYWLKIKLRIFPPHSHLTPSLGMNPFEFLDELFIAKTRLSVNVDFVILACVVLTQYQSVTDRRTEGHPDCS